MCSGALLHARVARVWFCAPDDRSAPVRLVQGVEIKNAGLSGSDKGDGTTARTAEMNSVGDASDWGRPSTVARAGALGGERRLHARPGVNHRYRVLRMGAPPQRALPGGSLLFASAEDGKPAGAAATAPPSARPVGPLGRHPWRLPCLCGTCE